MRWKVKTETTIPISVELSKVIQEQQNYIRQNLNENYEYLFCARTHHPHKFIPKPEVMHFESLQKI